LALAVRSSRREEYIPCTMTTNNADWERGWYYLRNAEPGLPLHQQGAPGEGPLLVPRGVPAPAPGAAGLAHGRVDEAGGPRADCGVHPRQPPPPADRPFDGEAAPHLQDDRGRGPRHAGEIAAAACSSRGRSQPPGRGALSSSGRDAVATMSCGHSRCSPPAHW
jgi:hypothetical protein